ncbi:MAG TPA: hypothetical protein VFA04_00695 [Bryobacteraceae bacterium]|nr:hypothetical protein [Bryobacteraceae bacterium]
MATLAPLFDRFMVSRSVAEAPARLREQMDEFLVRAVPNEDVFLFTKAIDNTLVVRESDPAARSACWRMIASSAAAVAVVVGLLAPSLYGLLAGYRLEALKQEEQRLETMRSALELQEARLLSPARLQALAKMQRYVDPAPGSVVYLEGKPGHQVARAGRPHVNP